MDRRSPITGWWWVVAFGVGVVVALGDVLTSSKTLYERDVIGYWYPQVEVWVQTVAAGTWPLWNRLWSFGVPLFADPSVEIAYPFSWLNLILSPVAYYKVFVFAHVAWAALGMWRLTRRLGLSEPAAFTASVGFGLSGPLLSSAPLYHHFAGASWLPWSLLCLEIALARPGVRSARNLGFVGAAQIVVGSGDMCLVAATLAFGRLLGSWVLGRRTALLPVLATLTSGAALALALSAVQWVATAALLSESWRDRLHLSTVSAWSVHPVSLVDLLVPGLVSTSLINDALRTVLYDSRGPLLSSTYLGVGFVLLAGFGAIRGGHGARAAAIGGGFFLGAALGHHLPFHAWVARVPGFGTMRYPSKFLLPVALCVALLAAFGVEAWTRRWSAADAIAARRLRWVAALVFVVCLSLSIGLCADPQWLERVLTIGADPVAAASAATVRLTRTGLLAAGAAILLWWRGRLENAPTGVATAWLLVACLDLAVAGRSANRLAPDELLIVRPRTVDLLREADARRIYSTAESKECLGVARGPAGWPIAAIAALGGLERLSPPTGARWGFFGSFDGEFTGLGRVWAWPFTDAVWSSRGRPEGIRLLEVAGVDHVVFLGRADYGGLPLVAEAPSVFECPVRLLRVPDPLPWAYVVGTERPGDAVASLVDPEFDPRREVFVVGGRAAPAAPGFVGRASLIRERGDEVVLDVEASADGVVVLLEAFDTGWRATVDGGPAEVLRANVLFRAVRVAAGRHTVRFVYRPPSVMWGATLSLVGVVAASVLSWRLRRPASATGPNGR